MVHINSLLYVANTYFSRVKKRLCCVLILLYTLPSKAQEVAPIWQFSAGPAAGFLMPHHNDMHYLIDGHIRGIDLNILRHTLGNRDWHHWYNFPTWGVNITALNLATPHLGYGVSVIFNADFPLDKNRKLFLKAGIGPGFIEKPFDQDDNFQNSAIGSQINAALAIELHTEIPLSSRLSLKPGIAIHHFSNGAFKIPNSGINVALLKLVVAYNSGPLPERIRENRAFTSTKGELHIGTSAGLKEILPIGGTKYPVVNLFAIWQKRFTPKSGFGVEAGVNYNSSLQHREKEGGGGASNLRSDNYRAYLALSHTLHFDPVAFRIQAGSYVAPAFKDDGLIFFRYHLIYQWTKFQVFTGLKSHFAKADCIEIGLTYRVL